ncbi:hypothetical protein FOA52_013286 [Chlamydomonas sp. UWO 241]|nr:hypothetical protein FOA52_013286 [Chlamydomonas sp. UWO 241]
MQPPLLRGLAALGAAKRFVLTVHQQQSVSSQHDACHYAACHCEEERDLCRETYVAEGERDEGAAHDKDSLGVLSVRSVAHAVTCAAMAVAAYQLAWTLLLLLLTLEGLLVLEGLLRRAFRGRRANSNSEPPSASELPSEFDSTSSTAGPPPTPPSGFSAFSDALRGWPDVQASGQEADPGLSGTWLKEADPGLSGTWLKVDALSESQDEAADLLSLGGFARQAVKLFKGMEFSIKDGTLSLLAMTKLPFVKVGRESYALDGALSCYNRRDMRKGKFQGYVVVVPGGGVDLHYSWGQPLPGECIDEIRLVGTDDLKITTRLSAGGRSCAYTVVYKRGGGSSGGIKDTGRHMEPQPARQRSLTLSSRMVKAAIGEPGCHDGAEASACGSGHALCSSGAGCSSVTAIEKSGSGDTAAARLLAHMAQQQQHGQQQQQAHIKQGQRGQLLPPQQAQQQQHVQQQQRGCSMDGSHPSRHAPASPSRLNPGKPAQQATQQLQQRGCSLDGGRPAPHAPACRSRLHPGTPPLAATSAAASAASSRSIDAGASFESPRVSIDREQRSSGHGHGHGGAWRWSPRVSIDLGGASRACRKSAGPDCAGRRGSVGGGGGGVGGGVGGSGGVEAQSRLARCFCGPCCCHCDGGCAGDGTESATCCVAGGGRQSSPPSERGSGSGSSCGAHRHAHAASHGAARPHHMSPFMKLAAL